MEPDGEWPFPVPRIGVHLELPASIERVEWFGRGPGETYRDVGRAARVGRFERTIDALQTHYVYPQENGNRMDTRWARLTTVDGTGLRVGGEPVFDFSARRWSTAELAAGVGLGRGRSWIGRTVGILLVIDAIVDLAIWTVRIRRR